uniref:Uncharacterized protein n=1 Tax=Pinguiococcus pyrenoidosus TaxID=172671 RepID=A0A7R9YAX3_9STRA|mmetsp:Transcript_17232/g.65753  ORF Transcript_17232/g.65753 Transcript_17232/m.65753 type:complete len:335 (+) Transcript_17232:144-1148(+)|eukprot:scaffold699_cov231-Pinguiococcus_pyrenoidosus.AAC.11
MIKGVYGALFALLFFSTRLNCANALARPRHNGRNFHDATQVLSVRPKNEQALHALQYRQYGRLMDILDNSKRARVWKDRFGCTLLHRAVSLEDWREAVPLLLRKGVKLNALDKDGRTALQHALHWQNLDAAVLLVKEGADFHRREAERGLTVFGLLMLLARRCKSEVDAKKYEELLLLLLERGADISENLYGDRHCSSTLSFMAGPQSGALFDISRCHLQRVFPELMEEAIEQKDLERAESLIHIANHAALSEEWYTAMRAQLSAGLPKLFEVASWPIQVSLGRVMFLADLAGEERAKDEDRAYNLTKQYQALVTKQTEEMMKARFYDSDTWYG